MYIDAKREDFLTDTTLALSLSGILPDVCKDSICIVPEFPKGRRFDSLKELSIYIAPVSFDAGLLLCVKDVCGQFSFTENFENIIRKLNLTICNLVKPVSRIVRAVVHRVVERARSVVHSTVPRILRL